MKTLRLDEITIRYGENTILEQYSLAVDAGDLLVILGPSGCGKSTLLYAIAGLIKPECGRIAFDEKPVFSAREGINIPAEKRRIGFVFQDYSLWPHMSVYENIAYPMRIRGVKKADIATRVNGLLESVSLSGKGSSLPSQLSGGEKQRVAIARAIAVDPVLLLLDEPLANIDAALKTQLLSLISRLKHTLHIPVVYVTHDQKEAFEIASRMVVMDSGRIVQQGCPRHIYQHPHNRFVAGFVGENNFIEHCTMQNSGCGQTGLGVVRPEDIHISETGEYTGEIRKIIFRGSCYCLHVRTRNTCVMMNTMEEHYRVGDTVRFTIGRMHLLREQEQMGDGIR